MSLLEYNLEKQLLVYDWVLIRRERLTMGTMCQKFIYHLALTSHYSTMMKSFGSLDIKSDTVSNCLQNVWIFLFPQGKYT